MHYIYLHGFASSPDSAKGRYFRERFRECGLELHAPDLNEGGFSTLTLSRQLQQVERLSEGLAGELTIIGSSLGGYTAALFANRVRRVVRLVLLAPAFDFVGRRLREEGEAYFHEWAAEGSKPFYHFGYGQELPLDYGFVEDARRYENERYALDIPAFVVQGLYDDTVPPETAWQYFRENRESRLLLLHSDHSLGDAVDEIWTHARVFLGL